MNVLSVKIIILLQLLSLGSPGVWCWSYRLCYEGLVECAHLAMRLWQIECFALSAVRRGRGSICSIYCAPVGLVVLFVMSWPSFLFSFVFCIYFMLCMSLSRYTHCVYRIVIFFLSVRPVRIYFLFQESTLSLLYPLSALSVYFWISWHNTLCLLSVCCLVMYFHSGCHSTPCIAWYGYHSRWCRLACGRGWWCFCVLFLICV